LLDGIKILELKKNIDERGFFAEVFRRDWSDMFAKDEIIQANLSVSYPGMIRAWHRHNEGQVDHFLVLQGAIKICAYDDKEKHLEQIISSSEMFRLVRIPGYYWHGFKNIGNINAYVIYFVNKLYNYTKPDEERRPWNDPGIIDHRTGRPFDWNKEPHQ
jgi:dTDP-4-dehydrorhamnose 3,5-epimerase